MRIVVRSTDARRAREAQALLERAGVEATALAGPYRPAPDGEDICIIDAMDGDIIAAQTLARQCLEGEQPPLANLLALPAERPRTQALTQDPVFVAAAALDGHPALLRRQVEAGARLAVAKEERKRRLATASALGLPQPQPMALGDPRALYVGPPNAAFLAIERAFAAHGGYVSAAFSSFTGFDHLHDEAFDAVVLNGAQNARTALSLCAALRRNTTLYNLPTLLIFKAGDEAAAEAAIDRGATAVVLTGDRCEPGLGWLFEAMRRERRRRAVEHDLRALRDLMGDTRTGLLRSEPFAAHLDRLASDHQASGRSLALVAFKVLPAPGSRPPSDAAWRKGFSETASLAGRLLRECDSISAHERDVVLAALPASTREAAESAAQRVISVAGCTTFAGGEGAGAPLVIERSVVELQPGESGAGLKARALAPFERDAYVA